MNLLFPSIFKFRFKINMKTMKVFYFILAVEFWESTKYT